MSNPLRQSLYTLDDCLNGGDFKATAAVKSLKRIFPAVVICFIPKASLCKYQHLIKIHFSYFASVLSFICQEGEGVVKAIPMPGHPVSIQEENSVLDDCRCLHDLILSHDAIFLLTDTRESRWLPTLLCANSNKVNLLDVIFLLGRIFIIFPLIFNMKILNDIFISADYNNCSSWV